MKCPRCKTENGTRTVCSKCGYFMYHPDVANRAHMTKGQQAVEDTKIVGKKVGKVFKYAWMILTLIVMSFWLVALMVWVMGMIVD
ncbi:MAG: hypothetical protein IKH76_04840 [Clostridiales bacterium]|nr:hypothetical protein [Clostridiales bacterium]